MRGDESFADDLNVSPSTVSSEVALLLRPAEVKLVTSRFVLLAHFSSLHCWLAGCTDVQLGELRMEEGECCCSGWCPRSWVLSCRQFHPDMLYGSWFLPIPRFTPNPSLYIQPKTSTHICGHTSMKILLPVRSAKSSMEGIR